MAVLDLSIIVPDDQYARIVAALRVHLSLPADTPDKDAVEALRHETIRLLQINVKNVERDAARAAAEDIALIDAS